MILELEIIDSPRHKGIKRKARLIKFIRESNKLTLDIQIDYYLDDNGSYGKILSGNFFTDPNNMFPTNRVCPVATNETMVDPNTGELVEKDEEGNYPIGSIGEYDYFYNISATNVGHNGDTANGLVQDALLISTINTMVSRGRFD